MPYERSKNIGKYRLNSMANKANLEPDPQTLSHTEHFFFQYLSLNRRLFLNL